MFDRLFNLFLGTVAGDGSPFSFGAYLNPEDSRDINIASFKGVADATALPNSKITDLSLIPVQNQLLLGTCVGQAVGTEAEYRYFQATGKIDPEVSRRFLYAMAKAIDGIAGQGTNPRLVYKLATSPDTGCANALIVPNDNTLTHTDYINVPRSSVVLDNAKKLILPGFAFVDSDINEIRRAITDHDVFTGIIGVDPFAWNMSGQVSRPGKITEYHEILIKGFEQIGNDWKIHFRNSWGDKWGNNGDGWFMWSDYANYFYDGMLFTEIPADFLAKAKAAQYVFSGNPIVYGQSGPRVLEMQKRLQLAGHYPTGWTYLTGWFGETTRSSLLEYQLAEGVAPAKELMALNGKSAGPKTFASFNGHQTVKALPDAIIQVESDGRDNAIGDHGLADKAYGPMQIRQPVCDDVNRAFGTGYTSQMCLNNRPLSLDIFNKYMSIYATPKYLGRPVTDQDRARIWNGGPAGYKNPLTLGYWEKVKSFLV